MNCEIIFTMVRMGLREGFAVIYNNSIGSVVVETQQVECINEGKALRMKEAASGAILCVPLVEEDVVAEGNMTGSHAIGDVNS